MVRRGPRCSGCANPHLGRSARQGRRDAVRSLEELVFIGHGDTLDRVAAGDVGEDEDRMALSLARGIIALEVVA